MNELEKKDIENEIENAERREVLASLLKYTAVVGGASTVVLSASEAVAKSSASGPGKPKPKPKCRHGRRGHCYQCSPRKRKKRVYKKKKRYIFKKKKQYGNYW